MIGRLSMPKATEKFEPFVKKKYESGWIRKQLMFNMTCGDNRHMLSVTSGALMMNTEMFTLTLKRL